MKLNQESRFFSLPLSLPLRVQRVRAEGARALIIQRNSKDIERTPRKETADITRKKNGRLGGVWGNGARNDVSTTKLDPDPLNDAENVSVATSVTAAGCRLPGIKGSPVL